MKSLHNKIKRVAVVLLLVLLPIFSIAANEPAEAGKVDAKEIVL